VKARICVSGHSQIVSFALRFVMARKGNGKPEKRYGTEAAARRHVLQQVSGAKESGDLLAMGAALVAVNQWLGQYGFDWGVLDARDELRRAYRVKGNEPRG
jgi:hypothetical protein